MTRDDILLAAAQVFRQKGFHAASMNDIAQSVSLQKASLYHHISSKQEILLALLERGLDLLIQRIGEVAAQTDGAAPRLRRSMAVYLETLVEHVDVASVLLFEHRSLDAALREQHIPRRDQFESLWRGMIQDGVEEGQFHCSDPGLAAKYLLGVLNWTLTWYRPGGPLGAAEIADQFADFFFDGLRGCS